MKSVPERVSSLNGWSSVWEWSRELPAGWGLGSNERICCPPPPWEETEGETCENVEESTVARSKH